MSLFWLKKYQYFNFALIVCVICFKHMALFQEMSFGGEMHEIAQIIQHINKLIYQYEHIN